MRAWLYETQGFADQKSTRPAALRPVRKFQSVKTDSPIIHPIDFLSDAGRLVVIPNVSMLVDGQGILTNGAAI